MSAPASTDPKTKKSKILWSVGIVAVLGGLASLLWNPFRAENVAPATDSIETASVHTLNSIRVEQTNSTAGTLESEVSEDVSAENQLFEQVLGTWVLDADGIRRVIENRADGTATVDVKFGFLTALRYGSELKLELEWSLKDDVLTHTIVGGEPESGKDTLISDFGQKAFFKIVRISETEMFLTDFDDPPDEYLWKKVND